MMKLKALAHVSDVTKFTVAIVNYHCEASATVSQEESNEISLQSFIRLSRVESSEKYSYLRRKSICREALNKYTGSRYANAHYTDFRFQDSKSLFCHKCNINKSIMHALTNLLIHLIQFFSYRYTATYIAS